MKDEIKEILDDLKDKNCYVNNETILTFDEAHLLLDYITNLQEENKQLKDKNDYLNDILSSSVEYEELENKITNLQEENERLREDNFAYHQLMKMQNQREYRSKFLKDFQKEHGKNVFPDYDEIYKRYDNYKTRNEKAIEYIMEYLIPKNVDWDFDEVIFSDLPVERIKPILEILQGSDE